MLVTDRSNTSPTVTKWLSYTPSRTENTGVINIDLGERTLAINNLLHPDYFLLRPILITQTKKNSTFLLSNDVLNVYSSGNTLVEALLQFQDILISHFEIIANSDDSELTQRARILKSNLLSYMHTHD